MAQVIQYTVTGVDKLRARLLKVSDDLRKAAIRELKKGAVLIHRTAVESIMGGPKTGRTYLKGKNRDIPHVASAPGEPPATDTGNLASSILIAADEANDTYYVYVSNKARSKLGYAYGVALEFGSEGGQLKPRPFMRPAFLKHKEAINQAIRAAFRGTLPGK